MENGHGLVRQVQALHLDGGGRVLLLKFDHRRRDLALQLFFHLALFRLIHRALQGHFGLDPRMGGYPLGQQVLKPHLLQKLGAVADTDADILARNADLAPVQKAVDGHAVPLHLLHQLPQGSFVHGSVTEEVLNFQFKALIARLQRGQQPRAQAFVQRGGAAQGKDHLPFLPQHPGALHNDLPKAGCKRRVYHKLRPELGNEWCHSDTPLCWGINSTNCRARFSGVAVRPTMHFSCVNGSFSEDRPPGWDPAAAGSRAGDGMARLVSEEKAP